MLHSCRVFPSPRMSLEVSNPRVGAFATRMPSLPKQRNRCVDPCPDYGNESRVAKRQNFLIDAQTSKRRAVSTGTKKAFIDCGRYFKVCPKSADLALVTFHTQGTMFNVFWNDTKNIHIMGREEVKRHILHDLLDLQATHAAPPPLENNISHAYFQAGDVTASCSKPYCIGSEKDDTNHPDRRCHSAICLEA